MESTGPAPMGRHTRVLALPAPTPRDARQREADEDERNTEERYRRHQAFVEMVAEAVRRAEILTRLERVLSFETH